MSNLIAIYYQSTKHKNFAQQIATAFAFILVKEKIKFSFAHTSTDIKKINPIPVFSFNENQNMQLVRELLGNIYRDVDRYHVGGHYPCVHIEVKGGVANLRNSPYWVDVHIDDLDVTEDPNYDIYGENSNETP